VPDARGGDIAQDEQLPAGQVAHVDQRLTHDVQHVFFAIKQQLDIVFGGFRAQQALDGTREGRPAQHVEQMWRGEGVGAFFP